MGDAKPDDYTRQIQNLPSAKYLLPKARNYLTFFYEKYPRRNCFLDQLVQFAIYQTGSFRNKSYFNGGAIKNCMVRIDGQTLSWQLVFYRPFGDIFTFLTNFVGSGLSPRVSADPNLDNIFGKDPRGIIIIPYIYHILMTS